VPQEARIARNESLFREVNERIAELADQFLVEQEQDFVCECSRVGCTTPIRLTLLEYAAVREVETRFVVAPAHIEPEIETVVLRRNRYWVVEKNGRAGEFAADDA
jgi:hypothetical protein